MDEGYAVYIIAQWEVALQLRVDGFPTEHIVEARPGHYLSSNDVWEEAKDYVLKPKCINEVVPVAHRWLQIVMVRQLIKGDGFRSVKKKIGMIGFDNSPLNLQPWTKGPLRALRYAIKVQLSGHRGPVQRP